jgi:hypothetical protein
VSFSRISEGLVTGIWPGCNEKPLNLPSETVRFIGAGTVDTICLGAVVRERKTNHCDITAIDIEL